MAVSLATGSGKTVVFTQLISRLQHPDMPDARQALILVHRRELVQQAAKHCMDMYPDTLVEIEMASSHSSGKADITVASVQSIINRLDKFDPAHFKLILIDECHHAVSPTYLRCLEHFRALEVTDRTPVVVGVSATVSRFDGVSLGKVMDKLVYHM
jgi:ATP-dependent helicase IRC3